MREKRADEEETCGKEEISHLNCWTKFGGERKKNEGKKKRKKRIERRRKEE